MKIVTSLTAKEIELLILMAEAHEEAAQARSGKGCPAASYC